TRIERKSAGQCGCEDMLPAQELRVVAQPLFLILPGQLLIQAVGHLKIAAAEKQRGGNEIIGGGVVIEAKETMHGAAEVMEIIERGRFQITLRSRAGNEAIIAKIIRF